MYSCGTKQLQASVCGLPAAVPNLTSINTGSAEEVRSPAIHNRVRQVQKGKDPVAKRRERTRREVELRFDRYLELFTYNYLKRRWKDWHRVHNMLVRYAVPTLGTKKLSDIRRADLSEIYQRLDNTPSVARAMHATLQKMLRWAMSRDDLRYSPVDGVEAPPPLRPRSRYLSEAELSAALETSTGLPSMYGGRFVS